MSRLFLTFNLFIFSTIYASVALAESATHRFGLGASYGLNFDGDMYDNSQSLQLLYQYDRIQFNAGAKRYQLANESETIPDLSLLYSVHDGDLIDLKVGIGLEDTYPTVEYVAEYAINNYFGATITLNQTLNEDFGQNQRETVFGLAYYFYDNRNNNESEGAELRPSLLVTNKKLDTDKNIRCSTSSEEGNCTPEIKSESNPKQQTVDVVKPAPSLPYVVQQGDWLYKLRRKFGFDLDEIIEKNKIENPDLIHPGQVLE